MKKDNKQNLIDYLAFMLNFHADVYGYCVDYDANWNTQKEYIKDIFEFECCITFYKPSSKKELKTMFLEWISDYHCMLNVIESLDYSDNYKLEYFTPKRLHNKGEHAMVDYINNQIFNLIYA
jgi:hypothetical protein